jgi:hypothetical protein
MFSGHTIFSFTAVLAVQTYSTSKWIKTVAWTLFIPLPFLIIAGRQHYTVDVVRTAAAKLCCSHEHALCQFVAMYTIPMVSAQAPVRVHASFGLEKPAWQVWTLLQIYLPNQE